MNAILVKLPSSLAFLVGAMSIVAGGMVMRGWRPGYSVLSWLPVYNFAVGLLTLVPAVLLWVKHRYALTASLVAFGVHTIVLLLLLTGSVVRRQPKASAPWHFAWSSGLSSFC